jgi:adenine specific DNA methylase Mod
MKSEVVLAWATRTAPAHPAARITTIKVVGRCETKNRLIHGDNLAAVGALLGEGYRERFKLVYIDPPFFSNSNYRQKLNMGGRVLERPTYGDRWEKTAYLDMLHPRLFFMRELLREDGLLFVHCDWRMNSHIRLLLDEIFGAENFLNEIVWHYGGRGAKATSFQFPRNHDTVYVYGKSRRARLKKLYTENLLTIEEALRKGYKTDGAGRLFKTAPRGDYTDESIKALSKEDRIHRTSSGGLRIKYFAELRGNAVVEKKLIGDVWSDLPDGMHSPKGERTGFATQKPEGLLKRIISASTEEGDFVGDFFCGSGTTAAAAEKLKRIWIMCEATQVGIETALKRLVEGKSNFRLEKVG